MTCKLLWILAFAAATPSVPPSSFEAPTGASLLQRRKDELSRVFARWLRDFQAGRIEPGDVRGASKKPYLTRALIARLPPQLGRYSRLEEARDLFTLLKERGTKEDGERLLEVVAVSLKKKGGKFWEVGGKLSRVRRQLIDVLQTGRCPEPIQAVIVDGVRAGLSGAGPGGKAQSGDGPVTRTHKEPELAASLLPVLGHLGQPSFRQLFEDCLAVQHSGVQTAAADALARLGNGRSLPAVARTLNNCEYSDDVALIARAILKLVAAKKPEPTERDLKLALNVATDKFRDLNDWRARISLIPILRSIRSRGTVPELIAFLEDSNDKLGKNGKAARPYSGTLMSAAHEALVELSGFYADVREPEKWRAWWESVKDDFVLPPPRDKAKAKGGTVAQGFFGIPVSGNRVVFVVDISGSMQWPYESVTHAGKPKASGKYESRLERAKKELLKAVGEMTADSKFNVVFFSGNTGVWQKKLVWANRKNKTAIESYLQRINASGGTALYDGLNEAMQIKLEKRKDQPYGSVVDEIFLLSDGSPTLGTITNTERILEVVRTWNTGAQVRINAIFIGDEEVDRVYAPPNTIQRLPGNMPPDEFMKRLAGENSGRFVEPNKR